MIEIFTEIWYNENKNEIKINQHPFFAVFVDNGYGTLRTRLRLELDWFSLLLLLCSPAAKSVISAYISDTLWKF